MLATVIGVLWIGGIAALCVYIWLGATVQEASDRERYKFPQPRKMMVGGWVKALLYIVGALLLVAIIRSPHVGSLDYETPAYHRDN